MKKLDDIQKIEKIKEMLPDMCSANIELIIQIALKHLRRNAVREWYNMEVVARKLENILLTLKGKGVREYEE